MAGQPPINALIMTQEQAARGILFVLFSNLSAFCPVNHACYTLSEMLAYNWRRVLFLDFGVLLIGTAFIVVAGFTGNELVPPKCNASGEALLSSLAILISTIAFVEALRWTSWRLREQALHRGKQSQINGDASQTSTEENTASPTRRALKANSYYWKLAIATAFIFVSIYLGPPNPCERLSLDSSSISVLVGNLAFVCGFLLMLKANLLEN
jgi:hypothetical protein